MSQDSASIDLTNHFLIAMPRLADAFFGKSVVYVCEHSDKGALGLVINKAASLDVAALFERMALPLERQDLLKMPVVQGGPLQLDRGFVLHEPVVADAQDTESVYMSTLVMDSGLHMTTSKDILESMSAGGGPRQVLLAMGYAAWGEGQLESELADNSWLSMPADHALIFDTPLADRYDQALARMGFSSWMLMTDAGHA